MVDLATAAAVATVAVGCGDRSMASFPGAYERRENIVVGPLSLRGARMARSTDAAGVLRVGGWKSPLLLRAGHRARVTIHRGDRDVARLRYFHDRPGATFAELPHTMRFRACRRGRRSGSDADGRSVTFWSGFTILRDAPVCVRLRISVDGRPAVRRTLAVARSCDGA